MSGAAVRRGLLSVLLIAVFGLGAALPAHADTLQEGSSGPAVSCWQQKLRWVSLARPVARVPLLVVDGRFGPATKSATQAFQRATRLSPDGVVGTKTQTQMAAELGTAGRDRRDEYASALYYAGCGTKEPRVGRPAPGYPLLRSNPHTTDPHAVQYYATTTCTHLDAGLDEQRVTLSLRADGSQRTDVRTAVARSGLRQLTISLGKSLTVASGTYHAQQGVALLGDVMYISAPGCSRRDASLIVCEWRSVPHTVP